MTKWAAYRLRQLISNKLIPNPDSSIQTSFFSVSFYVSSSKKLLHFGLFSLLLGMAELANAQIIVNSLTVPQNIGRTLDAEVSIAWTRTSAIDAVITTVLPSEISVNPPAPPAGCSVVAGPAMECQVPAGASGSTGIISFNIRGTTVGGFNLTATATGGSFASSSSNVRSSGDLTITNIKSPLGDLSAGQSTTFTLNPEIAVGGDDVPVGANVVVTNLLPAAADDFLLSGVTFGGPLTPSCNTVSSAQSTRTLTCTYTGAFSQADLNASTIILAGQPLNNGNFQNSASISSGSTNYVDRDDSNNTANAPFEVTPGGDLRALGNFPATPVLVDSNHNLVLTYDNQGPMNSPAGGTISTIIPADFIIGALPVGCVNSGAGSITVNPTTYNGTLITCTAGAVTSGTSQNFTLPLTMPNSAVSGDFPIEVEAPVGFTDFDLDNNQALRAYNVSAPYADLRLNKSKTSGPRAPGATVTNSFSVINDANSPASAAYGGLNGPLRVVDWARPEEVVMPDGVTNITAGWNCSVDTDVVPPFGFNATYTTRVTCETTDTGTLAPGASRALSYQSTLANVVEPIELRNRACTGGQALTALGLNAANGPSPADSNTANDCTGEVGGLVLTNVTAAEASIVKTASVDGVTYADSVELAGDEETMHWRMVVTTAAGSETIPTLRMTDPVPGRVSYGGGTPAVIVTTSPNTYGSCPNLPAGSSGDQLDCSFTNVPPDTTITVDFSVQRPVTAGLLTNTASLASPNSILTATGGGQLSDSASVDVAQRVDIEVTSKTVQPATPRVGQPVEFIITVRNNGTDSVPVGGLLLTDVLNTNSALSEVAYEVLGASGTNMNCAASNYAAGEVSCTNTNAVARNTTRTVTIEARILKPTGPMPDSGNVFAGQTNRADVELTNPANLCEFRTGSTSCNDATSQDNNFTEITFDVQVPEIDMQQRKESIYPDGQTAFGFGDQLKYRFRIQSVGPSRAEGIIMTDTLNVPSGFSLQLSAGPQNINAAAAEGGFILDTSKNGSLSCSQAGANGVVTCQLSAVDADNFLDPNQEVNFELTFDMTPGTYGEPVTFGNIALICADETSSYEASGACDSNPAVAANNIASVNDIVFPKADMEVVSKTVIDPNVAVMQPFNYTVVVRNNGPQEARGVQFSDPLPNGMQLTGPPVIQVNTPGFESTTCSGNTGESAVNCTFGTVQANAELTLTIPVRINTFTTATLTNTAVVSVDEDATYDTDPDNNEKSVLVNVERLTLSGRVFQKADPTQPNDPYNAGVDAPISGIPVNVTGTDIAGNPINTTLLTNPDGSYSIDLPPSNAAGYTVTRGNVPMNVNAAGAQLGNGPAMPGAVQTSERMNAIELDANGVDYDFWIASNDIILTPPTISGYVYFDRNRNRERPTAPDQDPLVQNWTVSLWADLVGGGREKVCELTTNQYGFYQFDNVRCNAAGYDQWAVSGLPTSGTTPPGFSAAIADFSIEFSSDDGLAGKPQSGDDAGTPRSSSITGISLNPGDNITEQNLPIDPAGVIYDSLTRQPVPGAQVFFEDQNGVPVNSACLIGGTNPVVTNATGMYQFLLDTSDPGTCGTYIHAVPREYSIRVVPPGGYLQGPSEIIPACNNALDVGNPGPFDVQNSDNVPSEATTQHDPALCPLNTAGLTPFNQASTQYYFRFNLTTSGAGTSGNVVRNHIPIDPILGGAVRVVKTSPKLNVTRGEMVPYRITATNTLSTGLTDIVIEDQIPAGFQFVSGSARLNGIDSEPEINGRNLRWPANTMAAGEEITIQLLLVVGSGVGFNEYVNRAWAMNNLTNTRASNLATATVRVVPDPIFDCSDIIGQVFDDQNRDGYQNDGEPGIPGVRLVSPRGWLITTDNHGRFHVACADVPSELRGANFILKLDERSLPSGYRVTTENPRVVRVTQGRMVKLNFGAAIHRVVRLDLTSAAFNQQHELLPEYSSQMHQLLPLLHEEPSILRIAYQLDFKEEIKSAQSRIDRVRQWIKQHWEEQDCCYDLLIEEEVIPGAEITEVKR